MIYYIGHNYLLNLTSKNTLCTFLCIIYLSCKRFANRVCYLIYGNKYLFQQLPIKQFSQYNIYIYIYKSEM